MTARERNLVITGFMGTGKSCVAQRVAERLGRCVVDMDDVIVERAGRTIPEIFRLFGEDTFRQLERTLCQELAAQEGLVIATGGGCLVDERNRELMARNGLLVCLDCEFDHLMRRLGKGEGRPMLWGDSAGQRVRELLASRHSAYAQIPYHVDTTHLDPDQVAERIAALYRADPIFWDVKAPGGGYRVHLFPGGLGYLGTLVRTTVDPSSVILVSDEHVWPLYGAQAMSSLRESDLEVHSVVVPAGEQHKSLDTVSQLYDAFIEHGLDRSGVVVALGGGVITDMAGFAAATYMRGVALVQVPTTLLGMVDASVGGKVAVDHPRGKNLVGAFVRPVFVLLDPETLDTLPDLELRAGMAEIIKAGIIGDAELFAALERGAKAEEVRWVVERALQVKIDIVQEDPFERGRRAVLNLGHTFAHAYEVLAGYTLHHGVAVAVGLAKAAQLAEMRGLCSAETRQRIVETVKRHGLPVHLDQDPDRVYQAMQADKKRRGRRLRFVLPREIGDVVIDADVTRDQVISVLEEDMS